MQKTWFLALGLVLAIGVLVQACRANQSTVDSAGRVAAVVPAGSCAPGRQGCPCDAEGADAACGTPVGQYGNYVTCAVGRSICGAGRWGPCITSHVVSKSLAGTAIGPSGLHTLSTTTRCPEDSGLCLDHCDRDPYVLIASGAGDVDASVGTIAGDAGLMLAPSCNGLECQVALDCPGGSPTTLTGIVRDPAGVNPVYRALVYVPIDPEGALVELSSGASCDSCAATDGIHALAIAQTATDGSFVLTNVPSTDLVPGKPIPLVVQIGKWRREVMLSSVPKCRSIAVAQDDARLPRNQFDGFGAKADIPKMAIATGSGDPFECALLKMGLDAAEFQVPGTGTRRIDSYLGTSAIDFPPPTIAHPKSQLVGSLPVLMSYDMVILPCEGLPVADPNGPYPADDRYADNVAAYASAGGRLLATHRSYKWLAMPSYVTGSPKPIANATNPATGKPNPFFDVANWNLDANGYSGRVTADIDTTLPGNQAYPKGQAFASWMQTVGASSAGAQLGIDQPQHDIDSVTAVATRWIHDDMSPGEPFLFSFDMPLGAGAGDASAGGCGRVGFADFHVSPTAVVDPNADGACRSDSDCGFTATCRPGLVGTCAASDCTTTEDCGGNGYSCVGVVPARCVPQPCLADGDCESNVCASGTCGCLNSHQCFSGVCSGGACNASTHVCTADSQCGSVEQCSGGRLGTCQKSCSLDADCTHGEVCTSGQCQGCHDDGDCASRQCNGGTPSTCSASAGTFPLACRRGKLSAQEDALEFMLLDLTACASQTVPAPVDAGAGLGPVTFTEDFASPCAGGFRPVWRELQWQASIPSTASIDFSAQSVEQPADGGAPDYSTAQAVLLATARTSTQLPGVDVVYLDTGTTGKFNVASPPVASRSNLRLTVTMRSTADLTAGPTLMHWLVKADCVPAE